MESQFSHGYALIVGVSDLKLTAPARDAQAVANVLVNKQRAGYPQDQVYALINEKATRQEILNKLDWLADKARIDSQATIIIYFSCHGVRIRDKAGAVTGYVLVPYGFNRADVFHTGITGKELTDKIRAIQSQKLVVLLDCCHAAGLPEAKSGDEEVTLQPAPLPPDFDQLKEGTGLAILASCQENEDSYGGAPYSVFTTCLLNGLQGSAATYPDGMVHIFDLLTYLTREVPNLARPQSQLPLLKRAENLMNFALCFYAGGESQLAGISQPGEAKDLSDDAPLTPQRLQRLKAWLSDLRAQYDNKRSAIKRIQEVLDLLPPEAQYATELKLLNEQTALSQLDTRLGKIEAVLNASGMEPQPEIEVIKLRQASLEPGVEQQNLQTERLHQALLTLNYFPQERDFQILLKTQQRLAAFLISGPAKHGQRWLLNRLLRRNKVSAAPIPLSEAAQFGMPGLWQILAEKTGMRPYPPPKPQAVIDRLVEKWNTQDVVLLWNHVQAFSESLINDFLEGFWAPLSTAASPENSYRMLFFLLDNTGVTSNWRLPRLSRIDLAKQPISAIQLPPVKPIDPVELKIWLENQLLAENLPEPFCSNCTEPDSIVQEILTPTESIPEWVLMEICDRCNINWSDKESQWLTY